MKRAATLIFALALASPAVAADQFDLSCMTAKPKKRSVPFTIKIDLVAGEWCIGKCEIVSKIASVTTSMIVLSETDNDREGQAGQWVNRLTGEYYFYDRKPGQALFGWWSQKGTCEPAPFTGFGAEKVKF